jgi:hypothetical protein
LTSYISIRLSLEINKYGSQPCSTLDVYDMANPLAAQFLANPRAQTYGCSVLNISFNSIQIKLWTYLKSRLSRHARLSVVDVVRKPLEGRNGVGRVDHRVSLEVAVRLVEHRHIDGVASFEGRECESVCSRVGNEREVVGDVGGSIDGTHQYDFEWIGVRTYPQKSRS